MKIFIDKSGYVASTSIKCSLLESKSYNALRPIVLSRSCPIKYLLTCNLTVDVPIFDWLLSCLSLFQYFLLLICLSLCQYFIFIINLTVFVPIVYVAATSSMLSRESTFIQAGFSWGGFKYKYKYKHKYKYKYKYKPVCTVFLQKAW